MKIFAKWFLGVILVLFVIYSVGPKPAKPDFNMPETTLPASLTDLEREINDNEKAVKGLKPDNEARIIWADTAKKEKTKIAFLYVHGFSASQAEGDPVHKDIAKKYNANLYLTRLSEHGIDLGDSTLINLTADEYEASAERAMAIAKRLGEEVVVIGTSTGGALTLFMASRHPEIKAIVLYSPCVKLYDATAVILNKHWGLQIARLVSGGKVKSFESESEAHSNYWQLKYRIEALVALQNLVSNTMKPEVFSKIKCPVFLAYYYKNEEEQDNTVSVPAMLEMYEELGTPSELKQKMAFPETGAHVISSYIRSKGWQSVERETDKFLTDIVKL
ncbi:MAG TPA: acyl-CoA thioester hydrolase/BAAT C-terminal domain-containing protein [Bacteroidales bacterium]|nr:acyl-CoA thioester hydrolase/BAAT C-terminal domain-containing protein [Bacteroidales bacterium]